MEIGSVVDFVREYRWAVLSTRGPEGLPQAALMGVAATDDGEIIFDTSTDSRKYRNLLQSPEVAIVGIAYDEVTLQLEGRARLLDGEERTPYLETYFDYFPGARLHAELPDAAFFAIRPAWARITDFRIDSFGSDEWSA